MEPLAECPECGKKATLVSKEWDYASFHVKHFLCFCGNSFKAYYHRGNLSHIINCHYSTPETRIKHYLRQHDYASSIQIAEDLGIEASIIETTLKNLAKKGITEIV